MNDYEVFLNLRADRERAARQQRHAQLAQAAEQNEKAQPTGLRSILSRWLPRFSLSRTRQPLSPCGEAPLNAH